VGASLLAAPALGQAYPSKPLRMIVPYPPGGGTDGLGRITTQFLSEKLGQPIVVQNIGGASGSVGSETVRRADPDGYSLLFNASLFVLGKTILPSCPYDPQSDFRAIAQAGEAPLVLLVNLNVPGTDYASTVAAIAKEPKKYFFALSSGGSAGHIATLAFLKRTGLLVLDFEKEIVGFLAYRTDWFQCSFVRSIEKSGISDIGMVFPPPRGFRARHGVRARQTLPTLWLTVG